MASIAFLKISTFRFFETFFTEFFMHSAKSSSSSIMKILSFEFFKLVVMIFKFEVMLEKPSLAGNWEVNKKTGPVAMTDSAEARVHEIGKF